MWHMYLLSSVAILGGGKTHSIPSKLAIKVAFSDANTPIFLPC